MTFINAKSAKEAVDALSKYNGEARLIAGGSDVMVDMQVGKIKTDVLVDVTKASDMIGIKKQGNNLVIGASTVLAEISKNAEVKKMFPSLAKGCGSVGSALIRSSATLVGNVVTAQPAADAAMSVSVLDPTFVIISKKGERTSKIFDLYAGFGKSSLDPTKELIKEVRIPLFGKDEAASFVRLELRKSLSLPMLNVSAYLKVSGGKIEAARITMAPVGVGPTRATEAEKYLVGKKMSKDVFEEAGKLALKNAEPRSNPLRGSKEYRTDTLPVLVRRALMECADQLK